MRVRASSSLVTRMQMSSTLTHKTTVPPKCFIPGVKIDVPPVNLFEGGCARPVPVLGVLCVDVCVCEREASHCLVLLAGYNRAGLARVVVLERWGGPLE